VDRGDVMVWIGLIIALFAGAILGFFAAAMFIARAGADENASRTAAKNVKDLPAAEPLHPSALDGDAYLGKIASMARDGSQSRQKGRRANRREPARRESAFHS
jgi:hypothetical protein